MNYPLEITVRLLWSFVKFSNKEFLVLILLDYVLYYWSIYRCILKSEEADLRNWKLNELEKQFLKYAKAEFEYLQYIASGPSAKGYPP